MPYFEKSLNNSENYENPFSTPRFSLANVTNEQMTKKYAKSSENTFNADEKEKPKKMKNQQRLY